MEAESEDLRLREERCDRGAYLQDTRHLPVERLPLYLHEQRVWSHGVVTTGALVKRIDDERDIVVIEVELRRAEGERVCRARELEQGGERERELVEELDVHRAQLGHFKACEDALQVRAAATVREHTQAGEHDARRGRPLQTPHDIAVGNWDSEVDRKHLETGEGAELRGEVGRVEVGGGDRKILQTDADEVRAGTTEEA